MDRLEAAQGRAIPSQRDWRRVRDSALLGLLVGTVIGGGIVLLGWGAWSSDSVDWRAIIVLAGLAVLAERFDFSLYGDSRVSLAVVPIFAALVLSGISGLAFVVPLAILASHLGSGRPLHKTLFNFGALMLAGGASVLILGAFGSASRPDAWPQVLGPSLLAAGANFLVNSGLVAAAISLSGGGSPPPRPGTSTSAGSGPTTWSWASWGWPSPLPTR